MQKDADAYRTISEVAEALDIPPHVLRFWETKFPQVKPLKRGGGRRYYRRTDTDLLRTIRRLLYEEGYTIRGVQRLLKTRGAATVAALDAGDLPPPQDLEAAGPIEDTEPLASTPSQDGDRVRQIVVQLKAEIAACRAQLAAAVQPMGGNTGALPAG